MKEERFIMLSGLGISCIIAIVLPLKWAIGILAIPFITLYFLWHEDLFADHVVVSSLVKIGWGLFASSIFVIAMKSAFVYCIY